MGVIVSLNNTPRQRLAFAAGGVSVRLSVWRQPLDGGWYCSVESPPGTPIASGRRLALDSPALYPLAHTLPGDLVVRSLGSHLDEPGNAPWGDTHVLRWEAA